MLRGEQAPGDAHTAGLQTTLCMSQILEVIAEKEQRDLWGIPFPSGLCFLSFEGWGSGERFSHSGLGGMGLLRPPALHSVGAALGFLLGLAHVAVARFCKAASLPGSA